MQFYPIRINHRDELWELAIRSKSHWKYPPEYLVAVRDQLKISAIQIGEGWGEIAVDHKQRWLGYYFILPKAFECYLEHLWVEPEYIGKGLGRGLLNQAIRSVKNAGFYDTIRVHSDPQAEGFFLKNGFKKQGEVPSKVEGGAPLANLQLNVTL